MYRYFKIVSIYRVDELNQKVYYLNINKWIELSWKGNGTSLISNEYGDNEISVRDLIESYPHKKHLFKNIEDKKESKLKRTRYLIECNLWKYGFNLLKSIHQEIAPQIRAKIEAESKQDNLTQRGYSVSIARLINSEDFKELVPDK